MSAHGLTEPFLRIPRSFAQSYEFRRLGGSAKGVLIELWSRFNGGNNGDLYLSYREAETIFGYGRHTTARAFKELQEGGFIRQTGRTHWTGKKASRWWINGLKNAMPKAIKGGLAKVEIVAADGCGMTGFLGAETATVSVPKRQRKALAMPKRQRNLGAETATVLDTLPGPGASLSKRRK